MTAVKIKQAFIPGRVFQVTNYYITRTDHPCFGARSVTIDRATTSGLHLAPGGYVPWPKAAQLKQKDDGSILFYGGGCAQNESELFLMFEPLT